KTRRGVLEAARDSSQIRAGALFTTQRLLKIDAAKTFYLQLIKRGATQPPPPSSSGSIASRLSWRGLAWRLWRLGRGGRGSRGRARRARPRGRALAGR